MKGVFEVSCVEETWALAKELAKELKPGDVVCLEGDLGAGKTTFTQGLAAALGVPGRVTSPTFCIVQEHQSADILLVHMDLYRLHGEEDVEAIGEVMHCGVKLIATAHGYDFADVEKRLPALVKEKVFERYLFLSCRKGVGTLEGILDRDGVFLRKGD